MLELPKKCNWHLKDKLNLQHHSPTPHVHPHHFHNVHCKHSMNERISTSFCADWINLKVIVIFVIGWVDKSSMGGDVFVLGSYEYQMVLNLPLCCLIWHYFHRCTQQKILLLCPRHDCRLTAHSFATKLTVKSFQHALLHIPAIMTEKSCDVLLPFLEPFDNHINLRMQERKVKDIKRKCSLSFMTITF